MKHRSILFKASQRLVRTYQLKVNGSADTLVNGAKIPFKLLHKKRYDDIEDSIRQQIRYDKEYVFDGSLIKVYSAKMEATLYQVPQEDLYLESHDLVLKGRTRPSSGVVIDTLKRMILDTGRETAMVNTAREMANHHDVCFSYFPNHWNKRSGYIWSYDGEHIKLIRYIDGKKTEERDIAYDRHTGWLKSFKADAYMDMLSMWVYPVYLDGSQLSLFVNESGNVRGRSVELSSAQAVTVYDMDGRTVFTGIAERLTLPATGMYLIVTANDGRGTVAIK